MAVCNVFNSLYEAVFEKVHNLGADTLKIGLCAAANAPVATNAVLTDLTLISMTNLSSPIVTITSSSQTSGVYKLVLQDLVLTASGTVPTFRYVVLYNDTATNKELIAWWDKGGNVDMLSGDTFTIDFDGTNGAFVFQSA